VFACTFLVHCSDDKPLERRPVRKSEFVQRYHPIFINVEKWGVFSQSDIDLNSIRNARSVPDFVENFERKLVSKPNVAPDVRCCINLSHEVLDAYFNCDDSIHHAQDIPLEDLTAEDESHGDREQPWRSAGKIEVLHIMELVSIDWKIFWTGVFGNALNGRLADGMLFYKFVVHLKDETPAAQLYVLCCLPFPIVI